MEPGGEERYKNTVLSLSPRKPFEASLLWLVDMEAITSAQASRLESIYAHRHQLSHELINYVVDPELEPDPQLLIEALGILKTIDEFVLSFEGLALREAFPASHIVLQMCIDAYTEGL